MATSTTKTLKHGTKTIYVGEGEYRNDIGANNGLQLTIPDRFSYAYITIMVFEGQILGAYRRNIMIPAPGPANVAAAYYAYAHSGGIDTARIDINKDNDPDSKTYGKYLLTIISATASSLYVAAVYAHY